jgi:hypothetical protein
MTHLNVSIKQLFGGREIFSKVAEFLQNKERLGVVATPVIPALQRLRQEEYKFEDSLAYRERPCLKKSQ